MNKYTVSKFHSKVSLRDLQGMFGLHRLRAHLTDSEVVFELPDSPENFQLWMSQFKKKLEIPAEEAFIEYRHNDEPTQTI